MKEIVNENGISSGSFDAAKAIEGGSGTEIGIKVDPTGGANLAESMNVSANGLAIKVDDYSVEADHNGRLSLDYSRKYKIVNDANYTSNPPASTSTITMVVDMTGQVFAGQAVRFKQGGPNYYGIVTAITSNLLTIAGAPLNVGIAITELAISPDAGSVQKDVYNIGGTTYNTADDTALLETFLNMKGGIVWYRAAAYMVLCSVINMSDDTTVDPKVNISVAGSLVLTTNSNKGLAVTIAKNVNTIDIDPVAYGVVYGDTIQFELLKDGGTGDADYLLVEVHWVFA